MVRERVLRIVLLLVGLRRHLSDHDLVSNVRLPRLVYSGMEPTLRKPQTYLRPFAEGLEIAGWHWRSGPVEMPVCVYLGQKHRLDR